MFSKRFLFFIFLFFSLFSIGYSLNIFTTDNTGSNRWSYGNFDRILDNTNNISLNLSREFPNDAAEDDWINMSGNVLLMHLDESSGTLVDSSGQGNNGTQSGGVIYGVTGKINNSLSFDGVDNHIYTSFSDNNPTILTLSSWVKGSDLKGKIIGFGDSQTGTSGSFDRHIWIDNSGVVYFGIWSGGRVSINSGSTLVNDNIWHNIIATLNGSGMKLYVDGNLVASDPTSTPQSFTGYWKIGFTSLGLWPEESTAYFKGLMDEVSIWNRSLTSTEVQTIYNTQKGNYVLGGIYESQVFDASTSTAWNNFSLSKVFPYGQELPSNGVTETGYDTGNIDMTGNVLLMHMDESSGTIVDSSGQGNNGTQTGGVTYSVDGMFNTALSFDGVDDTVTMPFSQDFNISQNLTMSSWIYYNNLTTFDAVILGKINVGDYGILVYDGTPAINCLANHICAVYHIGGDYRAANYPKKDFIETWTHIASSYDGSTIKLYVNGFLVNSTNYVGNIKITTSPLCIGADPDSSTCSSSFFNGSIDEVAIWNRTLSSTEILNIYKRGALKHNVSVRTCDDVSCSGESWTLLSCPTFTNCDLSSLTENRYFQFQINMSTLDTNYSPIIDWVNITYQNGTISTLNVTLNQPSNNTNNVDFSSIIFNCSAQSNVNLNNISIYFQNAGSWNLINSTSISSQLSSSIQYNFDLESNLGISNTFYSNGFIWNCLGYDTLSSSSWADSNYSFSNWALGTLQDVGVINGNLVVSNDNVLKLHLGESSGTLTDDSKFGNDGTQTGEVTYSSTGVFSSNGIDFDGVDDKITVTDSTSLDVSDNLTVSLWLNEDISPGSEKTQTYSTTGNSTFIVPSGVSNIIVKAWGAGGGGGGGGTSGVGGVGGGGGFSQSTISVTPGDSLTVLVGQGGGAGDFSTGTGGASSGDGAGGGGSSLIKRQGSYLLIAAGGGGGGGGDNSAATAGGAGGAGGAVTGTTGGSSSLAGGGGGGSQVSGGIAGTGGYNDGGAGNSNLGGDGGDGRNVQGVDGSMNNEGNYDAGSGGVADEGVNGVGGGGGGGGGLYGGGGGSSSATGDAGGGGGGGGSSYVTGTNTNKVSGSGQTAANTGDTNYQSSAGQGGSAGATSSSGTSGNDGLIVLIYNQTVPLIEKNNAYGLYLNSTNNLVGQINGNQNVSTNISLNNWYNVIMTYDGTIQKLYLNGVLKDSNSFTSSITTNANDLIIGDGFDGTIDEVYIWNRVLNSSEISNLQTEKRETKYTSKIYNYGNYNVSVDNVLWSFNEPGTSDLTIQVRTSDEDLIWGSWTAVLNNSGQFDNDVRHVQYRILFDVNGNEPYMNWFKIPYTPLISTQYIYPTPENNTVANRDPLVIKFETNDQEITFANIKIQGTNYSMIDNGDGTWQYSYSSLPNSIQNITFKVYTNKINLSERTFTYYPDFTGNVVPTFSWISNLIFIIIFLFSLLFSRRYLK